MENDKRNQSGQTGTPNPVPPDPTPQTNPPNPSEPRPISSTGLVSEHALSASEEELRNERPAKEALEEKNDRPAANTMLWAVLIAIAIMLIVYFVVFHGQDVVSSMPDE